MKLEHREFLKSEQGRKWLIEKALEVIPKENNWQCFHTPYDLCEHMISKTDVTNKSILVLFNYEQQILLEGARKEIATNVYERNATARQKCLDHHGYACKVCEIQMEQIYGIVAKYIIEVHHIIPLSQIGNQYIIDPIKDLVPICPSCHTIIHTKTKPCYTIEELKEMIKSEIDDGIK